MRITGQNPQPAQQIINRATAQSPATQTISTIPSTTPHGERIAALIAETGLTVSATEIQAIADALAAQGFSPAGMTPAALLRAIVLLRNDVLPAPGIVNAPTASGVPFLPEAAQLLEMAVSLLAELPPAGDSDDALRTLIGNLSSILGTETAPPPLTDDIARAILRNGTRFEWRLLAWYRGGRDPQTLPALIRDDLKGTLLAFLGALANGRAMHSKLNVIAERARALADRISASQTDTLAEHATGRGNFYAELSPGQPEERMYAGIRAEREDSGVSPEDGGRCTITLDIETSRLGPVRANLRFIGRNAAVTFFLAGRGDIALAEEMAGEFREMLRARGYEPGLIRFTTPGERAVYRDDTPPPASGMDRRG